MFATPPPMPKAAAGASGTGALIANIMPLVLVFAIMYFLLIRPQQRKMKEHKALVDGLRRGDQVVTSARDSGQGHQSCRRRRG